MPFVHTTNSSQKRRTAAFNTLIAGTRKTLSHLKIDQLHPDVQGIVPFMRIATKEAFLPDISDTGIVTLPTGREKLNGYAVVPFISGEAKLRAEGDIFLPNPRRSLIIANRLYADPVVIEETSIAAARKFSPIDLPNDQQAPVWHAQEGVAYIRSGFLRRKNFFPVLSRAIITLPHGIDRWSTYRRSSQVLFGFMQAHCNETDAVTLLQLSPQEQLMRQVSIALIANHLGVIAAGPSAEAAHRAVERVRAQHTAPEQPFIPTEGFIGAIFDAGLEQTFGRVTAEVRQPL